MDQMVLLTQRWLNNTYASKAGFGSVPVDGQTGWNTIYGLIRALQIELGISTANNFGSVTQARFKDRWPNGIRKNDNSDNVHGIIQGALWCKGYEAEYGGITTKFTDNVAASIRVLKSDIGLSDSSSTVDLDLMMALLSMKQFKLLSYYGGQAPIRSAQQDINRQYKAFTGIIPTDGLYGREMNTALIQVLQALEGYPPSEAGGYFGDGTRSRLKTVGSGTSEWVWLASVALICNGYANTTTSTWNSTLSTRFQEAYAIPVTGIVDPTTWMSLLTSKGDPNRACVACDTRFEISDDLAEYLKADGYKIVGRYLCEPDQENIAEADYFKALRTGELERIVSHGLEYFPIFQEYSTALRHFTPETGALHAQKAQAAAKRLGVPATVIYFAVDYDATDPEVTSNILPYFKAVHENLGGGYRVGIYASRNICTRVAQAGYAVASFVSDMSTGFSGNLGFPIPSNWVFDQFHEVSSYRGKWDLDRVAYSGRIGAVGSVDHSGDNPQPDIPYEAPPLPDTSQLTRMEVAISLIRELENAYADWITCFREHVAPDAESGAIEYKPDTVPRGVLRYLAKYYMSQMKFAIAGASIDPSFNDFMKNAYPNLRTRLEPFIGSNRVTVADGIGGKNDLAHLAYTLYCYAYANLAPEPWTGWAGDLATGMNDLHNYLGRHPSLDRIRTAHALIGSDEFTPAAYLTENGVDVAEFGVHCNYTDLCDDADAIYLGIQLDGIRDENVHTLSDMMSAYYAGLSAQNRYTAYTKDGLDFSSSANLQQSIEDKMSNWMKTFAVGKLLKNLAGTSTDEEQKACCQALAHYLLARSKQ